MGLRSRYRDFNDELLIGEGEKTIDLWDNGQSGCTNCLAADMDTLRFLFGLGNLHHVTVWRQTTELGFSTLAMVGNAYNNFFNEFLLRRINLWYMYFCCEVST